MTKPELVTFILENTTEYKKTHLLEKYKSELEVIAAAYQQHLESESGTENTPAPEEACDAELFQSLQDVENGTTDIMPIIVEAYEDNKKITKFRRADKNEFRQTAIEKTFEQATAEGITDPQTLSELTVATIRKLMENLTAFCPMNDNERKMLETIPLLADYENAGSAVDGKKFLQKVEELHNIRVATSRALMVSLKKKKYIAIGGDKTTSVSLLERGIKHLAKTA